MTTVKCIGDVTSLRVNDIELYVCCIKLTCDVISFCVHVIELCVFVSCSLAMSLVYGRMMLISFNLCACVVTLRGGGVLKWGEYYCRRCKNYPPSFRLPCVHT